MVWGDGAFKRPVEFARSLRLDGLVLACHARDALSARVRRRGQLRRLPYGPGAAWSVRPLRGEARENDAWAGE